MFGARVCAVCRRYLFGTIITVKYCHKKKYENSKSEKRLAMWTLGELVCVLVHGADVCCVIVGEYNELLEVFHKHI